jgi:hypothetical protein
MGKEYLFYIAAPDGRYFAIELVGDGVEPRGDLTPREAMNLFGMVANRRANELAGEKDV